MSQGSEADRRYAAEDIEDGGYFECVPELIEGLKDPVVAVGDACATALVKLGGEEIAQQIVPHLGSENVRLRNLTSEILGTLGQPAVGVLIEQLQSPDRDVRKFAVDSLMMIQSPEALAGMVIALNDTDLNVAATAADGLGDVGHAEHIEVLSKHLEGDSWMQCAVLRALGQIGGPVAFERVLPKLESNDILVKVSALKALGHIGDPRGFLPLLNHCCNQGLDLFTQEAFWALARVVKAHPTYQYGSLIDKKHLECLQIVLGKGKGELRMQALTTAAHMGEEALSYLGPAFSYVEGELQDLLIETICALNPSNIDPLLALLESPQSGLMEKSLALKALSTCSSEGMDKMWKQFLASEDEEQILATLNVLGPPILPIPFSEIKHLLSHQNPLIRIAATGAAARFAKDEFAPSLVAQLNSEEDDEVRQAIDNALIEIGNATTNSALGLFLSSLSLDERKRALSFFGFSDPKEQMDKFAKGLSDENPEIRVISLKVFASLKQITIEQIQEGLRDPVEQVQVEAVRCLQALDNPQGIIQFLENMLKQKLSPPERVKVEIAQILSGLHGFPVAVDLALLLLKDQSTWVRIEAVEALKKLGDPKALEPLKNLVDDENSALVEAVYSALEELD